MIDPKSKAELHKLSNIWKPTVNHRDQLNLNSRDHSHRAAVSMVSTEPNTLNLDRDSPAPDYTLDLRPDMEPTLVNASL